MNHAGHLRKDLQAAFTATRGKASQCSSAARSARQASPAARSLSGSSSGLSRPAFQSASQLEGWRVPELWGAANAVAAACRRSFSATRPDVACQAAAAAAPAPEKPAEGSESLAALLDFEAKVSPSQAAISLAVSTLLCVGIYAMTAPSRFSPLYSLGMGLLFAISIAVTRVWLVEHQWQARQRPETELGDPDSRFSVIDGVNVHWKLHSSAPSSQTAEPRPSTQAPDGSYAKSSQHPDSNQDLMGFFEATGQEGPQQQQETTAAQAAASDGQPRLPCAIHCYHGFGANTFSWSFVEQQLAEGCQARVTSHDMPGFGLTQRTSNREAYTLEFNGRLGRHIMDSETAMGSQQHVSAPSQANGDSGHQPPNVRRVLIGHSMGGACAAAEAAEHPEGLDALVLVAPAIIGRNKRRKLTSEQESPEKLQPMSAASSPKLDYVDEQSGDTGSVSPSRRGPLGHLKAAGRAAVALFQALLARLLEALVRLTRPFFALALRQSVRRRGFWEKGLRSAWVNKRGVTPDVVNGYRRPQLVRGWESGFLEFLAARTRSRRDIGHSVREAWRGIADPGPAERLAASLARHPEIKVLIIHGKQDRLVPASNSRRLVQMLPNAKLVELDACGHLPQEEVPHQFVDIMQEFLKGKLPE